MAALDPGPLDLRAFSLDSRSPAGVVSMLYNGVSNRSRGWKSKGSPEAVGGLGVKRWDGAARMSSGWNNLRKDPELWYKNGNCFVHLYEKGQSQREPAFKIPFECILSAKCEPLLERFMDRSISEEDEEARQHGRVDLYIPAPPTASRSQALQYHIATRNFFAWVCRRSMVGDHLGNALVALMKSIHEYRGDDVDNFQDLMDYLDEEGYLDMSNHPNHAVAILYLAENFEYRDLYIDAFAHCVGMSERLYKSPGYLSLSVESREHIQRARVDLDLRLSHAGAMIHDLLEKELSEAHLGLSTSARTHLDRFRAYIHSYYLAKFGHFPPPLADPKFSTIFKPEVYRIMRVDFEALYEYLVDERYTTTDNSPQVAQGGLCTLQSVQAFDTRRRFTPLPHPLPLLPAPPKGKESRSRISIHWSVSTNRTDGEGKLRPDQRLIAHAATMTATNRTKVHLLENGLVLAYRKFEENSIFAPQKVNRLGKLGLCQGDARKVRWIFVYAMYQTLRDCTEVSPEVKCQERVDYHLSASTKGPLPWEAQVQDDAHPFPMAISEGADADKPLLASKERRHSINALPLDMSLVMPPETSSESSTSGFEIKPDIDYFALTHRDENQSKGGPTLIEPIATSSLSRSRSLARNISLRRSVSKIRNSSNKHTLQKGEKRVIPSHKMPHSHRMSMHHEIIIHGYGNGTNSITNANESAKSVDVPDLKDARKSSPCLEVDTAQLAGRSASTSSTSSYGSVTSSLSTGDKSNSTTPTTVGRSPCSSRNSSYNWDNPDNFEPLADTTGSSEIPMTADQQNSESLTIPVRRQSTRKSMRKIFSSDDMLAAPPTVEPPPLPRRNSKRFSNIPSTSKRWSLIDIVAPLRERDDDSDSDSDLEIATPRSWKARGSWRRTPAPANVEEEDGDAVLDSSDQEWEMSMHSAVEVSPPWSWEQFADLGGLQPASPTT
ncbi:hypothetical protein VM1G_00070 [Cytospora mali]|uniref:DUF8004 domain-containing protein n=1 Tax=Cytospora mali TaxID=578113 RepID=A0A194VMC9_CYTMA|nr:hypothetical protein VM1G_00070 [Valsa mali]